MTMARQASGGNDIVGAGFFSYPTEPASRIAPEQLRFLDQASESDWAVLIAHCERRRCATGDEILKIGDTSGVLVIVRSGSFDVTAPTRRSRMETVGHVPAGSVFGEIGFFDGAGRSSNVTAAEPSEVLLLDRPSYERLARSRPALALRIVEDLGAILAQRFRSLTAQGASARPTSP